MLLGGWLCAAGVLVPVCFAQTPPTQTPAELPAGPSDEVTPRRLVHLYDFEETNDQGVKLGRGLALPPSWYPVGRDPRSTDPNFGRLPLHDRLSRMPGFSPHNLVHYSEARDAASGDYSLRLSLDSGNAGAYLQVGALPVVAGSDYLVTAKVRTSSLEHAGARLRTYFVDDAGRRIDTSTRQTPRLRTRGEWVAVDLKLPGEHPDAAYIGLEIELIQPTSDPRHILGNQQIVLQDVKGEAWFDDIAIWQLPHVQLSTGSPVNITRDPAGPHWDVSVRDLTGGELVARMTVYDHAMNIVARERRSMGWGRPSRWRWSPALPGFGWYLTELTILESSEPRHFQTWEKPEEKAARLAAERVIARTYNAVLWLPAEQGAYARGMPSPDAERFALVAEGMSTRELALLPELARAAGLGTVIVSAWDRETTLGALDLRLETLQRVVAPLRIDHKRIEISFSPVPEELEHHRGIDSSHAADVFAAEESVWMPYVQPILVRQGQQVNTWQLGTADEPILAYRPELPATVARMFEAFRHWAPAPVIGLPWRLDQPARPGLDSARVSYAVQWPGAMPPDRLVEHLDGPAGLADAPSVRRLHLRPVSAERMPHPARVTDLAIRMVHAWAENATGIALPDLWTPGLERRESLLPDPLLGVAANVAQRLVGYRAVGRLNLGEDRVALIFQQQTDASDADGEAQADPHRDGMIVAWNIKAPPDEARLAMYLGESPTAYDVWGNAAPVDLEPDGLHHVPLTDTPTFITGIDTRLALFRGGFHVDEPFVASTRTLHNRTVELTNPWPITVSGSVRFTGPEGWTIRPHRHQFSLAAGKTMYVPVTLQFPVQEVAGGKMLTADVEVTADRRYGIQLATPLELGLEGVRLEASLALEPGTAPGTTDAAVTCIITNTGGSELMLNAFATLPGHARTERLVPRLEPGQTVIRRFRFLDAAPALARDDIRLGVRETNGPAVLNKSVGIRDVE